MSELDRRSFLRWLAASPLFATLASCGDGTPVADAGVIADPDHALADSIATAADALDAFDLERVAESRIATAHWAYLQTGTDDETTLRRNREGFERLHIRPRRLVGVDRLDLTVRLFDREWPGPIGLAPVGSQRAFHDEGERATARAAAARNCFQVLSSVSSTAIEDVHAARGEPVWFQLYASADWDANHALIRRVETAGSPVLVFTVDNPGGANRITLERGRRADPRPCETCHTEGGQAPPVKPMYRGLPGRTGGRDSLTWDFVARLRDATRMRIVLKGIMTEEDAVLCIEHGVDGVWVSNHGGRTDPSALATIDALPEVVRAVDGRVPVIVDSGVRRGADVFKALARGADAVAIGRPAIWGLGAFGQAGVERMLEMLTTELELTMRTAGTPRLADIRSASIG